MCVCVYACVCVCEREREKYRRDHDHTVFACYIRPTIQNRAGEEFIPLSQMYTTNLAILELYEMSSPNSTEVFLPPLLLPHMKIHTLLNTTAHLYMYVVNVCAHLSVDENNDTYIE